jgi:hypothetical protein
MQSEQLTANFSLNWTMIIRPHTAYWSLCRVLQLHGAGAWCVVFFDDKLRGFSKHGLLMTSAESGFVPFAGQHFVIGLLMLFSIAPL